MAQHDDLPAIPQLTPGTEIAGYVIERKLGVGGMSVVYGAVQPRIGKRVAIKVLTRTFDDPSAVERFEQEARVVNAIGHQNIVDVFQFGELPDGRSYFVMEWLEGETLGARLKRGPIPLHVTIAILEEICDALDAAHEQHVVHRDLKADNVFLVAMRKGRAVKLLDFGLAKLVQGDGAASVSRNARGVHHTQAGILVGTPSYMSPEQARAKDVDARTDIYSLGCLAFQLLTGKLPFRADNPLDLLDLHLDAPPPSVAAMVADVPRPLSDLVKQMMAKAPADRPSIARIKEVLSQVRETRGTPKARSGSRLGLWAIAVTCVVVSAVIAVVVIARDGGRDAASARPGTPSGSGSAQAIAAIATDAAEATIEPPTSDPLIEIQVEPAARKQPTPPVTPRQQPPVQATAGSAAGSASTPTESDDVRFPGFLVISIDVAAEIAIDGTVRATDSRGDKFELRPGKHAIRITTPQRQIVEREVEIGTAMTTAMTISIPAPATPTRTPPVVDAGTAGDVPKQDGSAAPSPN